MGTEIERKFLPKSDSWRAQVSASQRLVQGYLSRGDKGSVRVRIAGDKANINIKSSTNGIERLEFEYDIPVEDAEQLLANMSLSPAIDKTRHLLRLGEHLWEIDEFHAANQGLVVAEIELGRCDEAFVEPDWLGTEVSEYKRYYNNQLAFKPYSEWTAAEKISAES